MSTNHNGGNIQNAIMLEEHDGDLNAKRVNVVGGTLNSTSTVFIGTPTLFAVVNSSAAELSGNVTLNPSPNFIGIVTVANPGAAATGNVTLDPGSRTGIVGNITLSDSKTYIGLTTATIGNSPVLGSGVNSIGFATVNVVNSQVISGNVTLNPSPNFIGIVTVANSVSANLTGNITLDPGSRTGVVGNMTLSDAKTFIGLVSVGGGTLNTVAAVTDITNPVAIKGNLTLSDPKGFIGLVTSTIANSPILGAGNNNIGDVDLASAIPAGVNSIGFASVTPVSAWPDPKGYIGLVTITGSLSSPTGNVTLDPGSKTGIVGNVTLSDSKTYIGLVTATSVQGTNPWSSSIVGNLTLSDPKGFIGLVTVVGSLSPAAGNVTLDAGSRTGIVGNLTLSDSKGYIGLVSIGGGILNTITAVTDITNPVAIKGNITINSGTITAVTDITNPIAVKGNLTLSDSKTYIGLVTATSIQGTSPWTSSIIGNITLSDPKGFIGLVTIVGSLSPAAGNVTLDPGSRTGIVGNVTLSDSKAFIGLVSIGGGILNTVTAVTDITNPVAIKGNLTLSDSKTYVGLVTATSVQGGTWNVGLSSGANFVGIVTVANPSAFAGNLTLDAGSKTGIVGNVTITDSKSFIGLVSIGGGILNTITAVTDITNPVALKGNLTLSDSKTYIGLVTATLGASTAAIGKLAANSGVDIGDVDITSIAAGDNNIGNVDLASSIPAGVNSIGFASVTPVSAWPDPKGYIGLVTITGSLAAASGNVTLDPGSRTGITGNVTLSDSKTFIGLTTTILAPTPIVGTGDTTAAFTSSASGSMMNVLLRSVSGRPVNMDTSGRLQVNLVGLSSDTVATVEGPTDFDNLSNGGFALYTFTPSVVFDGTNWDRSRTANIANATTGIGLPGAGILGFDGTDYRRVITGTDGRLQGNVTINNLARTITGNVTLSDAKTYIGLVTSLNAYGSAVTVYTGVISASGNTTIATPPSGERFFLKNLHVSSLGRSELEIRSGATTLIPFTSLSTTSGFFEHYGELGLPARANNDALVINLTGTATISYMANVRYAAA